MKIPKYWAHGQAVGTDRRGRKVSFTCWHWSEKNHEEAKALADARAVRLLNRMVIEDFENLERYPYGVQPMREEIIQTMTGSRGEEIGIITRNGYGALVLNAAQAMFMDIDLADEVMEQQRRMESEPGFFARLFGTKKPPQDPEPGLEEKGLAAVRDWAVHHRDLSLRVYRTRMGLRLLVTNRTFQPTDPTVEKIMTELDCDPLYIKLCRLQECFRARLTPKPWRCGLKNPPGRYPFENEKAEARYRRWLAEYERNSAGRPVCRMIESIGSQVHPEIAPVLELHDKYCCINVGRDLA